MSTPPEASRRSPLMLIIVGVLVFALVGGAVVAVPFIGVLAAVAIPNFVAMQLKSKRAEVPSYVNGLKTAELAYDAAFDEFVAAGDAATARRSVTRDLHPWVGDEAFAKLGWTPDGPVRGGYWVEVGDGTFSVHGVVDLDGDGEFAEYVATESTNATMVSSPNAY